MGRAAKLVAARKVGAPPGRSRARRGGGAADWPGASAGPRRELAAGAPQPIAGRAGPDPRAGAGRGGPGARCAGPGLCGAGAGTGPVRRRLRGGAPRLGVTAAGRGAGRAAGLRRGWPWSRCAAARARGWGRSLLGRLPWEGEGRLAGRLQRICPHLPAGRGAARCARGGAGCRPAGSALICKGFGCADSPEKPAVPW